MNAENCKSSAHPEIQMKNHKENQEVSLRDEISRLREMNALLEQQLREREEAMESLFSFIVEARKA